MTSSKTSEDAQRVVEITGRRTSLFTRVALLFAETLHVPYRLQPIADMTRLDAAAYGGNPALKMPVLRHGHDSIMGTENICRALAAHPSARGAARIAWSEHLASPLARNAQELVSHCMSAQVQLVMGTVIGKLPVDNIFFVKTRAGMEGSLEWLDHHLGDVLGTLPVESDISFFEVSLFCLVEHLQFRGTLSVAPYSALASFAATFGNCEAARATAYDRDGS